MTRTPEEASEMICCTQQRSCRNTLCMAWQEEHTEFLPGVKREPTGKGYCGHIGTFKRG
jgi:hypothetical protein